MVSENNISPVGFYVKLCPDQNTEGTLSRDFDLCNIMLFLASVIM
jgi:hypothetical protein